MNKELQDKVWSILQKEFKEEAKKDYQYAVKDRNRSVLQRGASDTLEHFFGIHNLTSDIEPKTETNNKLMKARIKETGEIINIAEYDRVILDKCNSYGNPIEVPYEDIELLRENSYNIDWEQRRYELTKELMNGFAANPNENVVGLSIDTLVGWSVSGADEIIKRLQEKRESNDNQAKGTIPYSHG